MAKYVDLSERVTATFYSEEYEEWTQQTVTVADVLDSVCDDYTVLPSAQPERKRGKWINDGDPATWVCSNCDYRVTGYNNTKFCPNCGADMRK